MKIVLVNEGKTGYTFFVKVYISIGLVLTGILALSSFVVSTSLVRDLLREQPEISGAAAMKHHFALYLPQRMTPFYSEIITGAEKAASESAAALTIHSIDSSGVELGMASRIGVDGIIICPTLDDRLTRQEVDKLQAAKIPIVLINHNVPSEQPCPFIGTNNFDLGKKAGSLVVNKAESVINIAVVYSEKSPAIYAERELFEMGINGAVSKRFETVISAYRTDLNPRDAEKIVYQLVRSEPSLTTIVFTDSNDTLAGTQALIDLNMVGRVQIIGFGSVPAIQDYIQKGIISGSLVVNPELIGRQSILSLTELVMSGYTSTYVDTGIQLITSETK